MLILQILQNIHSKITNITTGKAIDIQILILNYKILAQDTDIVASTPLQSLIIQK